ncbi:MAG UNVERIFIED_CONTAM: hypothetical protein LVR18_27945 [Planctomycetaceae bacterium]
MAPQTIARSLLFAACFVLHTAITHAQTVCLPLPRLLTTTPMGGQTGTQFESLDHRRKSRRQRRPRLLSPGHHRVTQTRHRRKTGSQPILCHGRCRMPRGAL